MTGSGPVRVGIIGAGLISGEYLDNLTAFPDIDVVAVGDLVPEAARVRATAYGVPVFGDPDAVLTCDGVEIVVNLTIPAAHAEVAQRSIAAGKHVYNEKPITVDPTTAAEVLRTADEAGLRVGGAPDTFLGPGWQAVRRAVARGDIGDPQTALTLMQQPGPESWHPNPAFFFQPGAGPLFDLGPYYITGLVQLLGAATSVAATGGRARDTRVVGAGLRAGQTFAVSVPTHISANVTFVSGRSATSVFSFDSPLVRFLFELTGTEATLRLPDPNRFDGDLLIRRRNDTDWQLLESTSAASSRGTGVLEMARAIREDRPHRASGVLAAHVLEIMTATAYAAEQREVVAIGSRADPAELLPADWDPHVATLGSTTRR